jgi:hypothetical protein
MHCHNGNASRRLRWRGRHCRSNSYRLHPAGTIGTVTAIAAIADTSGAPASLDASIPSGLYTNTAANISTKSAANFTAGAATNITAGTWFPIWQLSAWGAQTEPQKYGRAGQVHL